MRITVSSDEKRGEWQDALTLFIGEDISARHYDSWENSHHFVSKKKLLRDIAFLEDAEITEDIILVIEHIFEFEKIEVIRNTRTAYVYAGDKEIEVKYISDRLISILKNL